MASRLFGTSNPGKPHLVIGPGGIAKEVYDVRLDVETAFSKLESQGGYLRTDEYTNPVALSNNAIKTSFATSASPQAFVAANLDGSVGNTEMVPPRVPTITSTAHANVTAVAAVLTGRVRDSTGALVAATSTINITNGGGTTDVGDKALSIVDSVSIPAQGGAAGSLQIGFGNGMGLSARIKSRTGAIAPLRQIVDGTVVTTGTFTNPASYPITVYTPATAPNGVHDYSCTYEVDPS